MPGMAYAFDHGWLSVAQLLALKPLPGGPAPRSWTRAYQYAPGAEPLLADPIDWGRFE